MSLVHDTLSHCALKAIRSVLIRPGPFRIQFQPNSFNSVQLTERTRNCIYSCYKGNNLRNILASVIVLVHDTSSQCAFQMYEVSLKYL